MKLSAPLDQVKLDQLGFVIKYKRNQGGGLPTYEGLQILHAECASFTELVSEIQGAMRSALRNMDMGAKRPSTCRPLW